MIRNSGPNNMTETRAHGASQTRKDGDGHSPVDSGYAWVIAFSCMFCNVLSLGLQRAYGILFVEFLILFQLPVGITALVMAVQSGVMSIAALLTQTVVLSLLSERQTVVLGGFLGGLGIILSSFADTLFLLILTQSVLVGLSSSMILGPGYVITSKYFSKHRSLAIGVASMGGNIGAMLMPLFTYFLLSVYGVRGALLLLGATYLNVMVAAILLRPFGQYSKREENLNGSPIYTAVPSAEKTGFPSTDVTRQSHGDVEIRKRTLSEVSQNIPVFSDRAALQRPLSARFSDSSHPKAGRLLSMSTPDLFVSAEISRVVVSEESDSEGEELFQLQEMRRESQELEHIDLSHDKNEEDLFSLETDSSPHRPLTTSSQTTPNKARTRCAQLCAMFDFHLFKRPLFLMTIVACPLASVPAALFGMYLPAMAGDKGVSSQNAALLLTIFGGCGIFSRIAFGYLADLGVIPRPFLLSLVVAVMSVVGLFTPLYPDFPALAVFSALYGLFGIVYFSLMPVVIVDLMGLQNMAKTLGFTQLFMGAAWAAAHPVIGYLRDVTGNYHASFHFMSVCGLVSSVILLFTPVIRRLENRLELARTVHVAKKHNHEPAKTGHTDNAPLNGKALDSAKGEP